MVRTARFAFDREGDNRLFSLGDLDMDSLEPPLELPPAAAATPRGHRRPIGRSSATTVGNSPPTPVVRKRSRKRAA